VDLSSNQNGEVFLGFKVSGSSTNLIENEFPNPVPNYENVLPYSQVLAAVLWSIYKTFKTIKIPNYKVNPTWNVDKEQQAKWKDMEFS
jgi:hypothetical protein